MSSLSFPIEFMSGAGTGGAGGGTLVNDTTVLSATGTGSSIALNGATRVSLTFGSEVGDVYQAHVQLEDAATDDVIGVVYWPSSGPRWFDIPSGVTDVQLNVTYWSDAGGTDTVSLTVAG